jgi:hypothetical protein
VTLADMAWTEISIHSVVSEFLRAERHKYVGLGHPWLPIIDNPNLNDPLENHRRLRLLYIPRAMFMVEIPPDTKWYEVKTLTEAELDELYLSARHTAQWDQAGSKLDRVAPVVKEPLKSPPETWARIILWGHDKAGPFSIIEGCHRLLGYAYANPRPRLNLSVYVGLSPSYCYWHYADPRFQVGQGLFREKLEVRAEQDWLWVQTGED